MTFQSTICLAVFLFAQGTFPVFAQAAEQPQSPQAVATLFLDARNRGDWKAAIQLVDPENIKQLQPYAVTMFQDEGRRKNIFRKYFVGHDTISEEVRYLPHRLLVGNYMEMLSLMRSSRQGVPLILGHQILGSFQETPELVSVVAREQVRSMGVEYENRLLVSLRKVANSWYVRIDEEVFLAQVLFPLARDIHAGKTGETVSLDLRFLKHDKRMAAFAAAARRMSLDRFVKYEFAVGDDEGLAKDLRLIASAFGIGHRTSFVEEGKPTGTQQ